MRGESIHFFIPLALMTAACATKSKLPPPPVGSAGETISGADQEGAFGDGTDAATAALQGYLAAQAGSARVLFALDAATLSVTAQQTLVCQAGSLRQHPKISFTNEGHCHERGTREYNLALGDRRAKSASDYLIAQGISPARIRTSSYGKERPEALASDDQSYADNRRAASIVVRSN